MVPDVVHPDLRTASLPLATLHLPALRLGRFRGVLVVELSECREAVDRARAVRLTRRSRAAAATDRVERHRDGLVAQRLGGL